jgi:Tol biopolymer transport system component
MWGKVAGCIMIVGCGYPALPATGGATDGSIGGDVVTEGTGSSGPTDCLPLWMDHTLSIRDSMVQEITELSSIGDDRNPWISDDGLRIFFSRDLGPATQSDIYYATRASKSAPFSPAMLVPNLNTARRENRVSLTSDEAIVVLSADLDGSLDIHMTQKSGGVFGVPAATHLAQINNIGTQRIDPFISADGLHIYLASDTGPGGKLQMLVTTRASATDDFEAPVFVPGINDNSINQTDPSLSRDEHLLVYSAFPSQVDGNLWYATRSSATANFGTPVEVPGVNTIANEFDPMLSPDGCELYFSSTRKADGKFHLFHAQITK